ncbi:hypothetical protein P7C73_g1782, partial [Tremellales sp. Uapishka_1]
MLHASRAEPVISLPQHRPYLPSYPPDSADHRITGDDSPNILRLVREDYRDLRTYTRALEWRSVLRGCARRSMIKWYAIALLATTFSVLLSTQHSHIVDFCRPISLRIRDWPAGWLIPIVLLVILSFPPLVGHEILGILIGLVWELWIGFAILAAGTFLGEIATWIAFKFCCQARAAKFEKKNKLYGALTQLIREKSFMFILVLRFSAVPGHITTAVSASAGANFWSYLAAAFLTLPKQLVIVYLGHAYGTKSRRNTIISTTTTCLTLLGTVVAAVYIYYQMRLVMRRQDKLRLSAEYLPTYDESTAQEPPTIMIEKDQDALHARRPWLFSTPSYSSSRTPSRTKSLPGPLDAQELREWLQLEEAASGWNTPAMSDADSPFFAHSLNPSASTSALLSAPSPYLAPTRYSAPDVADLSDVEAEGDTYPPRIRETMSLDLVRNLPAGGREIAADADRYAIARGARRDGGRSRGESRAALLGRPIVAESR